MELSKQTGIPVKTLRDLEQYIPEHLDLEIPRDKHGLRVYSQEWVEYFQTVKKLKDQNFEEIKEFIPSYEMPEKETGNTELTRLQDNFTEVQKEVAELRVKVESLEDKLIRLQIEDIIKKVKNAKYIIFPSGEKCKINRKFYGKFTEAIEYFIDADEKKKCVVLMHEVFDCEFE